MEKLRELWVNASDRHKRIIQDKPSRGGALDAFSGRSASRLPSGTTSLRTSALAPLLTGRLDQGQWPGPRSSWTSAKLSPKAVDPFRAAAKDKQGSGQRRGSPPTESSVGTLAEGRGSIQSCCQSSLVGAERR